MQNCREVFSSQLRWVGDYNPDWAITFKEASVKHIYFIAETKGSMSSMELRAIEKSKIECARKFFRQRLHLNKLNMMLLKILGS